MYTVNVLTVNLQALYWWNRFPQKTVHPSEINCGNEGLCIKGRKSCRQKTLKELKLRVNWQFV